MSSTNFDEMLKEHRAKQGERPTFVLGGETFILPATYPAVIVLEYSRAKDMNDDAGVELMLKMLKAFLGDRGVNLAFEELGLNVEELGFLLQSIMKIYDGEKPGEKKTPRKRK